MLGQKNKQIRSGGKSLETYCFPRVGKAPSADSIRDDASFPEPFRCLGKRLYTKSLPFSWKAFLYAFDLRVSDIIL